MFDIFQGVGASRGMGSAGASFFGGDGPERFNRQYQVFPMCFLDGKDELEKGNKIILPQSALDHLARLNISYPMLFELSSPITGRTTHVGVQEFVAEEGTCHLPYWLMLLLDLAEEDLVVIKNTSLPKGTFVKLQPCSKEFLNVHNPRAVLENTLRNFATLTVGDCIVIEYNSQRYEIEIIEAEPSGAISIIEADVNVEFAPPKDYEEPSRSDHLNEGASSPIVATAVVGDASPTERDRFIPFGGGGHRADGRAVKDASPALGPATSPVTDADDEEQPWRMRIPKGVKYTQPPFGYCEDHMTGAKSPTRHEIVC